MVKHRMQVGGWWWGTYILSELFEQFLILGCDKYKETLKWFPLLYLELNQLN